MTGTIGTFAKFSNDGRRRGSVGESSVKSIRTDRCSSARDIEGTDDLLVEYSSREEGMCAGEIFDEMDNLGPWMADKGSVELVPEPMSWSGKAAKITAEKSDSRGRIVRTFDDGIDLSSRDISVAVRPGTASSFRVELFAPDRNNKIDMWRHFGSLSGWFRADMAPTETTGTPNLTDVRAIRISTWTGGGEKVEFFVDDIRTTKKASKGKVILTFDDIHISQFETGFSVLREYDFPGVVGVIPSNTNSTSRISVEQLREMQAAGWDIVSHPQMGTPLPELSAKQQRVEIRKTKRWLVTNGFEHGAKFIIWPYNAAGRKTFDIASKYHYLGFGGGQIGGGTRVTGPLTISRVDGDAVETAMKMVDLSAEYNTMTVIMYHKIGIGKITIDEFRRTIDHVSTADVEVISATQLWENYVKAVE